MVPHTEDPRTDDDSAGDLEALRALVGSEGWAVFQRLVAEEWGAEPTLRKIDQALATIPRGDQDAVTDTVQQIQTARREIFRVLAKPKARIDQLAPKKPSTRPFDAIRRIGGRG